MRNLMSIMALPGYIVEFTRTSDGFYLARAEGDIGFNVWLGKPNAGSIGKEHSAKSWQRLSFGARKQVVRCARARGVALRVFLPRGVAQ